MRTYKYIGPNDLLELVKSNSKGDKVALSNDVQNWVERTEQKLDYDHRVIATYVIDLAGNLRIADRHSEHVVCAGGENVLSAGEITFDINGSNVSIFEVTNQSTGYCPEPESWPSVDDALEKAGLNSPGEFGRMFIFRKCDNCGLLNIVKEDWYVCVKCDEDLKQLWNVS